MTRTVTLTEGQPVGIVQLDDDVVNRLLDLSIVSGRRLGAGQWDLTAGTKVGALRIGDVVVRVAPKVDVRRLFFLLGYTKKPGWRSDVVDMDPSRGLLSVIAEAFAAQAERAVERGLLQGYVQVEDSSPVLRGRLREQDQVRHNYALALPLLVRYDDYTVDIAENQLFRSAVDRLLTLPDVPEPVRRRLRSLRLVLHEVSPIMRGAPLPVWHPNRLNQRYHVGLWLAELILKNFAVDHRSGRVFIDGFLIDMAKVFEDFVTRTLADALVNSAGGRCVAQDKHHHLDVGGTVDVRPDLVWYLDDRPVAVVDAKYKAEKPAGFPNADLYQTIGYCTVLGLSTGHLVYARGNETARSYEVVNSGIRIVAHALDLDTTNDELLKQVDQLANMVVSAAAEASLARL